MALPTLTPTSNTSATILTSSGTPGDVATACPIGVYSDSTEFLSGAAAQVAYVYKRLGGDVLDIELTTANVYANYEEAVLEYSYLVNLHQSKNALGSALGSATSSFDHKGEVSGSGMAAALKYPKYRFEYALRMGDTFSHEVAIGGTDPIYSASFDTVNDQQDYDLQSIISASAAGGEVDYAGIGDKRVTVREVYYRTPQQMWRFYGYYGGLNVVGDYHSYGQYSDQSTFQVIPAWQNKLQAVAFEDHLYTRTSHYSYEIIDNKLRLFPIPDGVSPEKWWVRFSVKSGPFSDDVDNQQDGVNNMNTLPFENIAYESINSIGKQWIRRFGLALSKETLGQIRGKFGGNVPIPGESVTLNSADLLGQAKDEQNALREELKTILAEMTYDKLIETDKTMADNQQSLVAKVPLKIFVG
jgi:hypothetical protein